MIFVIMVLAFIIIIVVVGVIIVIVVVFFPSGLHPSLLNMVDPMHGRQLNDNYLR